MPQENAATKASADGTPRSARVAQVRNSRFEMASGLPWGGIAWSKAASLMSSVASSSGSSWEPFTALAARSEHRSRMVSSSREIWPRASKSKMSKMRAAALMAFFSPAMQAPARSASALIRRGSLAPLASESNNATHWPRSSPVRASVVGRSMPKSRSRSLYERTSSLV